MPSPVWWLLVTTIAVLSSAECPTGFQTGTTQTCDCTASSIPCSAVTTECLCPTFDCNVQHQGHYGTFTQSNVGLFAQFNSTVKQDTPFVAGAMSGLIGAMKTCYSKYVDTRSKTASSAILAACTPADQDKYGKPPHTGIACCAGLVEVSEDRPLNRPAAERLAHPKIQMCREKAAAAPRSTKGQRPTATQAPTMKLTKWGGGGGGGGGKPKARRSCKTDCDTCMSVPG